MFVPRLNHAGSLCKGVEHLMLPNLAERIDIGPD